MAVIFNISFNLCYLNYSELQQMEEDLRTKVDELLKGNLCSLTRYNGEIII